MSTDVAGAIIGDSPPRRASPWTCDALITRPTGCTGHRLMTYAGLDEAAYESLYRRNLFELHDYVWTTEETQARARRVLRAIRCRRITRVVLLGKRVGDAFGIGLWAVGALSPAAVAVCIPHPSGRNRIYNDEAARDRAGHAVRWAALFEDTPTRSDT